jgi:2-C-methyl-D-erythritol 4-phosphate cytidylyltransferase
MSVVSVIIVAAGEGKRFGGAKQFARLRDKAVLDWSLEKFELHQRVSEIILVLKEEKDKERYLIRYKKLSAVVKGGEKRQDSVMAGFNQVEPEKGKIVLVHDAVRPLVEKDLISRVIEGAKEQGAVIPAIPLEDTVKRVAGEKVVDTTERSSLFRIQTPQGFLYSILKKALKRAKEDGFYGTDEASLVERLGQSVFVVKGDEKNIKITSQEDLKIAEAFLEI